MVTRELLSQELATTTLESKKKTWEIASEIIYALHPFYQEEAMRLIKRIGAPNNWYRLTSVRTFEPEPATPEKTHQLFPYSSLEQQKESLDQLQREGFLDEVTPNSYRLNDRGREVAEGFFETAHKGLQNVQPLPTADLVWLCQQLEHLVQAAETQSKPTRKPILESSRWTDPQENGSEAARIDQYLTDLSRFREDAHIASWEQYDIEGRDWEALTAVWREGIRTATKLSESLTRRGYTTADYANALEELSSRGWIYEDAQGYQLTAEGTEIREVAEAETDRIFFEGWSFLSETDLERMRSLSAQLIENVKIKTQIQYWELVSDIQAGISQAARDVVDKVFNKYFETPGTFFSLYMATGNAPKPFSVAHYLRRFPYIHRARAVDILEKASDEGLLKSKGNELYEITEKGAKGLKAVNDVFYTYLSKVDVLPETELKELEELLNRIVQSSLAVPEPAGRWALTNMHNAHVEDADSALARIDQHFDDLNAFRDDAHMATWKQYGIDGRSWEALTYLWRGQASSAADLVTQLPNRGYSEAEYAQSLEELTKRGWIHQSADGSRLTDKGRKLREEAEAATNRFFYGPWAFLDETEQRRLRRLLIQLKLSLEAINSS